MLISTNKFFKGNKIARASRGSEDFDFHHKIYLISTEVLKSFHDSPPHWQFICSQFSKKIYDALPKSSLLVSTSDDWFQQATTDPSEIIIIP